MRNTQRTPPSKFGVIGLTQVLAEEGAESGVLSYAVLPGAVATKLHLDIHPDEDPDAMMTPEHVAKKIFPLAAGRRRTGTSVTVYN